MSKAIEANVTEMEMRKAIEESIRAKLEAEYASKIEAAKAEAVEAAKAMAKTKPVRRGKDAEVFAALKLYVSKVPVGTSFSLKKAALSEKVREYSPKTADKYTEAGIEETVSRVIKTFVDNGIVDRIDDSTGRRTKKTAIVFVEAEARKELLELTAG
jgi:hypothetical protein